MWAILTHTHSMLETGKITQPKDVVHVRHTLRVWAGAIALDLEKNRWIDDGSTANGTIPRRTPGARVRVPVQFSEPSLCLIFPCETAPT